MYTFYFLMVKRVFRTQTAKRWIRVYFSDDVWTTETVKIHIKHVKKKTNDSQSHQVRDLGNADVYFYIQQPRIGWF